MIAKISATENLGGALGYNFKKVRQEEATILLAFIGTFEPCSDFFRAGFFVEKPLFYAKNVVFLLELLPFYELKKLLLPGLYWIE